MCAWASLGGGVNFMVASGYSSFYFTPRKAAKITLITRMCPTRPDKYKQWPQFSSLYFVALSDYATSQMQTWLYRFRLFWKSDYCESCIVKCFNQTITLILLFTVHKLACECKRECVCLCGQKWKCSPVHIVIVNQLGWENMCLLISVL